MISFPNAKINLGLNITQKRPDGFHNIETIFYPVGWKDALEITPSSSSVPFQLHLSGLPIQGDVNDNLLYKAYELIKELVVVPCIDVYLHKTLPMGAGLGGGSADAAFFINLMNDSFDLKLTVEQRLNIARQLGSDCAFFIHNKPVFAYGKGDVFEPMALDLSRYYVALVYPNVHSNTKEAYSLVKPQTPQHSLKEIVQQPPDGWKDLLVNDFEVSIFSKYPLVKFIKETLYKQGAVYACMSGSGSAVFGLFKEEPQLGDLISYPHWIGKMM